MEWFYSPKRQITRNQILKTKPHARMLLWFWIAICLWACIILYSTYNYFQNWTIIYGKVISARSQMVEQYIRYRHESVKYINTVEYTGKDNIKRTTTFKWKYPMWSEVKMYYFPEYPSHVMVNMDYQWVFFFFFLGSILMIPFYVIKIFQRKQLRKIEECIENCKVVDADFVRIQKYIPIGHKFSTFRYYFIVCKYKERTFVSDLLEYNPTPYLQWNTIKVFIEDGEFGDYYVDTRNLKK